MATNGGQLQEKLSWGRNFGNPGDDDCRFAGLNAKMTEFTAAKTAQGFTVSTYSVPGGTSNTVIKTYIEGLYAYWDRIIVDDAGYLWLGIPEEHDHLIVKMH